MKCKECDCCKKGFFKSKPDAYVCTGVLEPFVIENINVECTEYEERRNKKYMKSSEILLSLDDKHLEVFRVKDFICVSYKNAEIKDGCFLKTDYGTGTNFESACDNYLSKIRGKRLVFNANSNNREDIMVLG